MLSKQAAYELGTQLALKEAGLGSLVAGSTLSRDIAGTFGYASESRKEKNDRYRKAIASLAGATAAGVGTGLATDSAGYGALAAPLGGAAAYGLASLLGDRGAKW